MGAVAAAGAEERFADWTSTIERALAPGERYTATCAGEATDFASLNRGKVRQVKGVCSPPMAMCISYRFSLFKKGQRF